MSAKHVFSAKRVLSARRALSHCVRGLVGGEAEDGVNEVGAPAGGAGGVGPG
jgi:hypothetical protein